MVLKVLVLFSPFMLETKWTGAARRLCEILKRGQSVDVQYVVAFDRKSFSTIKKYPTVFDAIKPYNVYLLDLSPHHNRFSRGFLRILKAVFTLNKITKKEKIDLILSTSEADWMSLEAYITSKLSGKPWTSIWQPTDHLLEPTRGIGPITPFNVFKHINSKPTAKKVTFKVKLAKALTLLTQLKLGEKTLTLSVSKSVINSAQILNPKSNFHAINPGNGVCLKTCSTESKNSTKFQAVFFARLVPEKGFYDLPLIWKEVVKRLPNAKLAITGITIEPKIVQTFNSLVRENSLTKNIVFLGELPESELIRTVESSSVTVYPSVLDAFCLVALESLACGTPVVAYDIPALRENYGNCSAVLLSPKKSISDIVSNIMFLLENEELRVKLKKEARIFANSHSWDAVAKSEKEAYYKVISWKSKEKNHLEI